jgi:peptide/nickel transport system ATP-binding protein
LARGQIVGVVGVGGCGKSVTAMATMRLLPDRAFRVTHGVISTPGQDMLAASEAELLRMRGSDVAMIFQEPLTALNPTRRIGDLMVEVIRAHQKITRAAIAGTALPAGWKKGAPHDRHHWT